MKPSFAVQTKRTPSLALCRSTRTSIRIVRFKQPRRRRRRTSSLEKSVIITWNLAIKNDGACRSGAGGEESPLSDPGSGFRQEARRREKKCEGNKWNKQKKKERREKCSGNRGWVSLTLSSIFVRHYLGLRR